MSGEPYAGVDALAGEVFLTDSTGGLVSREDGRDLSLTAGSAVTVIHQDEPISTVSGRLSSWSAWMSSPARWKWFL